MSKRSENASLAITKTHFRHTGFFAVYTSIEAEQTISARSEQPTGKTSRFQCVAHRGFCSRFGGESSERAFSCSPFSASGNAPLSSAVCRKYVAGIRSRVRPPAHTRTRGTGRLAGRAILNDCSKKWGFKESGLRLRIKVFPKPCFPKKTKFRFCRKSDQRKKKRIAVPVGFNRASPRRRRSTDTGFFSDRPKPKKTTSLIASNRMPTDRKPTSLCFPLFLPIY